MMATVQRSWLRTAGQTQVVTPLELLFDLVFVFAVSQLSLALLEDFTWQGGAEAAILTFASISVWSNTMWVTSLFDTRRLPVRTLLIAVMVASLLLTTSITEGFGQRALIFAVAYAAILIGRPAFILLSTMDAPLRDHFIRTLIWASITGAGWVVGAIVGGHAQILIWGALVVIEFVVGWIGHPVPAGGHTETLQYSLASEHLGERTRLFFLIALGETILSSSTAYVHEPPTFERSAALLVALAGTIGIWWTYFQRSEGIGLSALERSPDQASVGRQTVLTLTIMVAGIILAAVGDEIVIAHPGDQTNPGTSIALFGGPVVFFAAQLAFMRSVTGHLPRTRLVAIGALVASGAAAVFIPGVPQLVASTLTAAIIIAVAIKDSLRPAGQPEP